MAIYSEFTHLVIFHSYVSLPEGTLHQRDLNKKNMLDYFCFVPRLKSQSKLKGF